ncbi:MAG: Flagellar basal-body rod protein FlgC [Luteibacter sp.]|uniref:flagellar basal body rod protein FlgC n=1 Tax=Luteibacter sp. TaxID=1886636 RepID=UPI001384BBD6|nr:flagellar basal body rod C-terminal domain-containing protein [Luteibacter sp.]KAF1004680.1 MAG: Flagellar basal-body rod protein FlgC [Luteibacter sp.]
MSDSIFAISRSGMDVERERMQVIAQNLANAGAAGTTFTPMRLVSGPSVTSTFADLMGGATPRVGNLHGASPAATGGTQVYGLEPYTGEPRKVHEPGNPHADAQGFVTYPGVDHAGEMSLMVQTVRIYEANVVMYNAGRSMFMRALDIGARS